MSQGRLKQGRYLEVSAQKSSLWQLPPGIYLPVQRGKGNHMKKGRRICGESMRQDGDLSQKKKIQSECIAFYNKSVDIFMGNVQGKLRSLVDNIDFSQLWSNHTLKNLIQHGSRPIESKMSTNRTHSHPATCSCSTSEAKCSASPWIS